jgi:SIR2-like domain
VSVPDDEHYWLVARQINQGTLTPFLGAGASLLERPDNGFQLGQSLPTGGELARMLASEIKYPDQGGLDDLLKVSEYFEAVLDEGSLYELLHGVFAIDFSPNGLHRFLARLPAHLRARQPAKPPQLIITTNYDDALERAFDAEGEEYDLVWYEAKKGDEAFAKFRHKPPGGEPVVITSPNTYADVDPDKRTVILKLHGAVVDRQNVESNSFVVTENSYIDYLGAGEFSLPVGITQRMAQTNFLFLGYSMRDWNMRVILSRIWGRRPLGRRSWAVQLQPSDPAKAEIEDKLWEQRREVAALYASLEEYVERLDSVVFDDGVEEPDAAEARTAAPAP